ncbi:uncharacterized protein LOC134957383 [Pseudophryne corroboree]|uniref:uncharacterized protein LOC134957383 n=1 Tax=Pseudophryne corroboree TaxID=495146 RepID=UPI0030821DDE
MESAGVSTSRSVAGGADGVPSRAGESSSDPDWSKGSASGLGSGTRSSASSIGSSAGRISSKRSRRRRRGTDSSLASTSSEGLSSSDGGLHRVKRRRRRERRYSTSSASQVSVESDTVHCANTAVQRGLRPRVRDRIRKGQYVNIFALTSDDRKALLSAKKKGQGSEDALRSYQNWVRCMLIFAACYLETRPDEHMNVVRYQFLIHVLYHKYKGSAWRRYDEDFRRKQHGRQIYNFGKKDVELCSELTQGSAAPDDGGTARRWAKKPASRSAGFRGGAGRTGHGKCFAFNNAQCDLGGGRCRFRHSCIRCGGGHGIKDCPSPGTGSAFGSQPRQSRAPAATGASHSSLPN